MRDPLFWDLSFRKGFRGPVRGQMSATSKATVEQGLGVHITGHVYRDYEETLPPANCSGPFRPRKQPFGALLRPQNYHNLAATYPSKNPSPGIEPSKALYTCSGDAGRAWRQSARPEAPTRVKSDMQDSCRSSPKVNGALRRGSCDIPVVIYVYCPKLQFNFPLELQVPKP